MRVVFLLASTAGLLPATIGLLLTVGGLPSLTAVAIAQSGSRYDPMPRNGSLPTPAHSGNHDHNDAGHPPAGRSATLDGRADRQAHGQENRSTSRGMAEPSRRSAQPAARQPASPLSRPYGAAAATPPTTLRASAGTDYANRLMKATLTAQSGSRLTGSPIGLPAVVRSARDRQEQSLRINAYWDLCSAVADYYLSLHEEGELERLAAQSPQLSTPLRAAISKLKTRRDTALTAARATQHRLAALMRQSNTSPPLPDDLPHCGSYRTKFSQTFSGNGPKEAYELHQLLPLRHAELLGAARAVQQSEDWFGQIVRRAGTAEAAEGVVKALELHALNRRAFVQIARDYNRRITRYTELARPGKVGSDRLVAMLIKTNSRTATRNSRSSPLPGRSSSWNAPPETFRDAPRDLAPRLDAEVVPAGAMIAEKMPPSETSVLRKAVGG